MSNLRFVLLLLAAALICGQCSDSTDTTGPDSQVLRTPAQLTQSEQELVDAANSFGFELFQRVNQSAPSARNVFVSPLSVSIALGIAANGAEGTTRDEMLDVLEIDMSMTEADQAYHDLAEILIKADPFVTFNIANSFWSRTGKAIQPEFLSTCRDYFDARVEEIDFTAPDAADTINGWVDANTNGKITEIIKAPISGDLAALLLNAIYFKADWTFPFDTAATIESAFYLANGDSTTCDMMYKATDDDYQVYPALFLLQPPLRRSTDECQMIELPYGKIGFRMAVLLPDASLTADSLISLLNPDTWQAWRNLPAHQSFELLLPKFKFEFEAILNNNLIAMGMPAAFDPIIADFSNLFVDSVGWISEVKHKTFVQVDEKGTEAAAVTSVGFTDTMSGPVAFNRPFVFVIYEIESGAVLFMGKVADPTSES